MSHALAFTAGLAAFGTIASIVVGKPLIVVGALAVLTALNLYFARREAGTGTSDEV